MNKYFVIYRVPVKTMEEWRKSTTPEEMKEQGQALGKAMMEWTKKHESMLVEKGQPLGKTKTVTKDGVRDSKNDLNYYSIVEANSHDEAAKMFLDNPHITTIPDSFIDVMEIPHMGM